MLLLGFLHFYSRPQTSKNQIKVEMVGDNFTELRGEIAGPPDTPYEGTPTPLHLADLAHDWVPDDLSLSTLYFLSVGGRYHLEIKIPETYPFNPPKVRLVGGLCSLFISVPEVNLFSWPVEIN